MTRSAIVVMIDCEDDGRCGEDCSSCCNLAGDREWPSTQGGVKEGHFDTRGPECLAAEKLLRDLVSAGVGDESDK